METKDRKVVYIQSLLGQGYAKIIQEIDENHLEVLFETNNRTTIINKQDIRFDNQQDIPNNFGINVRI